MNLTDLPLTTKLAVAAGCFFILFGCYKLIREPNREALVKFGFIILGTVIISLNLYFDTLSPHNKDIETQNSSIKKVSNLKKLQSAFSHSNLTAYSGDKNIKTKVNVHWVE